MLVHGPGDRRVLVGFMGGHCGASVSGFCAKECECGCVEAPVGEWKIRNGGEINASTILRFALAPDALVYSQVLLARNPRCKKLSLALFQSGAKKLN